MCPHRPPPRRKEGRCLASEAPAPAWTLGEEARTFRTSHHPVWSRARGPGSVGRGGGTLGITVAVTALQPLGLGPGAWLQSAFCSRPKPAESLAPRPEPPGTPGPFPSFPHPSPTPSVCASRLAPPPPGRLPGCAVSCNFLRLSASPACGALYREPLEAGPPMGPQPPCPLTRTCRNEGTRPGGQPGGGVHQAAVLAVLGCGGLGAPRSPSLSGPEGRQ